MNAWILKNGFLIKAIFSMGKVDVIYKSIFWEYVCNFASFLFYLLCFLLHKFAFMLLL